MDDIFRSAAGLLAMAAGGAGADLPAGLRLLPGSGATLELAVAQMVARHLRFDAADPGWPDRDRVVVAPALSGVAACVAGLVGSADMFAVFGPAVGCGVGLALGERMMAARFGRSLVDHRTWVICAGDTLGTGAVQEAAWLAGAWRLGRLTVVAEVQEANAPGLAGFAAHGWMVRQAACDDDEAIAAALSAASRSLKPTLVACLGGAAAACGGGGGGDGAAGWLGTGRRLAGARRSWLKRLARHGSRQDFEAALAGRLSARWHLALSEPGPLLAAGRQAVSTAQSVRQTLAVVSAAAGNLPLLPGDAGWPAPPGQVEPPANQGAGMLAGGMGAVLCGVALHGGLVPVCVQPWSAADSVLPALRAAAGGGVRLMQVLAEPGPGPLARPEGGRAAFRAISGLFVFCPADAAEALECADAAIRRLAGPSLLLLTAEAVPVLSERPSRTRLLHGGYVAAEAPGRRAATLIASGPALHVLLQARTLLAAAGVGVAVVSLPCWEMFGAQEAGWRRHVLGDAPRVALDGDGGFGWERWLGVGGLFMAGGDAPAVADAVMRHLRGPQAV